VWNWPNTTRHQLQADQQQQQQQQRSHITTAVTNPRAQHKDVELLQQNGFVRQHKLHQVDDGCTRQHQLVSFKPMTDIIDCLSSALQRDNDSLPA